MKDNAAVMQRELDQLSAAGGRVTLAFRRIDNGDWRAGGTDRICVREAEDFPLVPVERKYGTSANNQQP